MHSDASRRRGPDEVHRQGKNVEAEARMWGLQLHNGQRTDSLQGAGTLKGTLQFLTTRTKEGSLATLYLTSIE
eukprot:5217783-Pyramimonas_sp.AAC.1